MNHKSPVKISRREFCKISVGTAATVSATMFLPKELIPEDAPAAKSKVALIRNPAVLDAATGKTDAVIAKEMLFSAVMRITSSDSAEKAWKSIFKNEKKVAVKLNCASRVLSPRRELVDALIEGINLAGIPKENIILWDRLDDELRQAGFALNTSDEGVKCYGTDSGSAGYEEKLSFSGNVGSLYSKILTRQCDALVSFGVLKDHSFGGVSIAMKNMYGAIHNPNKYHDNCCDPYTADVNNHSYVKDKLRLCICDGIRAQYNGGPGFKAQWSWFDNSIMASTDSVAIDRVGADIIDKKRVENKMKTLAESNCEPKWLKTAAGYGLGVEDMKQIEIV
ncbi:MAG: DUF362 domain-containing protein [Planctomycetes bacterium]|nr:DUF362 domain-containing protein [Planctomycetota bacterium]